MTTKARTWALGALMVAALAVLVMLLNPKQAAAAMLEPVKVAAQEEGSGCGAIALSCTEAGSGTNNWRVIATGAQGGYFIRATLSFDPSAPYVQFYGCDYLLDSGGAGAVDSPVFYGDIMFIIYNYGPTSPTMYLQALGVGETSNLAQLN